MKWNLFLLFSKKIKLILDNCSKALTVNGGKGISCTYLLFHLWWSEVFLEEQRENQPWTPVNNSMVPYFLHTPTATAEI